MKLINKNTNVSLILQAKNSTGGILNLTGASITANFKQYDTAATNLFTKRNTAAGGSDSEIEVLSAALAYYNIKILPANTSALTIRTIYLGVTVTISGTDYTDAFFIKINENKGYGTSYPTVGTTLNRPILTSGEIGFEYFDTDLASPFWWNGSEWV